jgi:hypothetical protein
MCGMNWRQSSQPSSAVGRLNLTGSATQVVEPMWQSLVRCISSVETHVPAERRGHQRSVRYAVPHWWLRHGLHNTVASHSFEGGS